MFAFNCRVVTSQWGLM